MVEELMEIGDEVVIIIPKEHRKQSHGSWGYKPYLNGVKATIIGFSEFHYGRINNLRLKPGMYVSRVWVKLKLCLEYGCEHIEESNKRIELIDKEEYERRLTAFRKYQKENPNNWRRDEFLRELPETPFWEGDFVRVRGRSTLTVIYNEIPPDCDPEIFQVTKIDYSRLNSLTEIGTGYHAYTISDKLGADWCTSASEGDMTLVERGPVWKFYHNEPITFGDIREEALFFNLLGRVERVQNPDSGQWTKDEVLKAIQDGLVHSFSISKWGGGIIAERFKDEDLGRRVAQATLKGFGLST